MIAEVIIWDICMLSSIGRLVTIALCAECMQTQNQAPEIHGEKSLRRMARTATDVNNYLGHVNAGKV